MKLIGYFVLFVVFSLFFSGCGQLFKGNSQPPDKQKIKTAIEKYLALMNESYTPLGLSYKFEKIEPFTVEDKTIKVNFIYSGKMISGQGICKNLPPEKCERMSKMSIGFNDLAVFRLEDDGYWYLVEVFDENGLNSQRSHIKVE
jgi:hypothetical protein